DGAVWNPQADPAIAAPYSPTDLVGKRRCKAALQRAFGLTSRPRIPLLAMSARLVAQKGLDLILRGGLLAIPDAQFVFLGGGERRYEQPLTDLAAAARARDSAGDRTLRGRALLGADDARSDEPGLWLAALRRGICAGLWASAGVAVRAHEAQRGGAVRMLVGDIGGTNARLAIV